MWTPFSGQMYWTDVWILVRSTLSRPWLRTALVGSHTKAELIRAEMTEKEYMKVDAHKLHGQLSFTRLPPISFHESGVEVRHDRSHQR